MIILPSPPKILRINDTEIVGDRIAEFGAGDVWVGRDATIIVSAYTERLRSGAISKPAAMPIRTFVQPGAFDPEAIAAMTEAFDAACEKLGDIDQPEVAREVIATRMVAAARLGERDPTRLLAAALRKPD